MYQCFESCSKHRGLLQHLMLLSQLLLAICKLLRRRNGLEAGDQLMHFNTGTFGWKIRQEGDLILLAGAVVRNSDIYVYILQIHVCCAFINHQPSHVPILSALPPFLFFSFFKLSVLATLVVSAMFFLRSASDCVSNVKVSSKLASNEFSLGRFHRESKDFQPDYQP